MTTRSTSKISAFLPAASICAVGLIAAVASAIPAAGTTASDRMVAAVFPPWWDSEQTLAAAARADLPIVRAGGIGSILVLASPNETTDAYLSEAGALFLLDPLSLAGCLSLSRI